MRKLICKYCGKEYETSAKNSRYCSEACRKHGRYHTTRAWKEKTDYNAKQRPLNRARREAKRRNLRT